MPSAGQAAVGGQSEGGGRTGHQEEKLAWLDQVAQELSVPAWVTLALGPLTSCPLLSSLALTRFLLDPKQTFRPTLSPLLGLGTL